MSTETELLIQTAVQRDNEMLQDQRLTPLSHASSSPPEQSLFAHLCA